MYLIYGAMRLYPFWTIPLALVLGQIGIYFRRRHSPAQWSCWGTIGFLGLTTLLWVAFRGDLHSDHWVRTLFE